jgi:hypothetical protein
MPYTAITKPPQGDPTRKSIIDTIIDDLAFLYSRSNTVTTVVNPSFEDDTDSDGIPDGWTRTLFSGGTFLRDNTDQIHGLYSVKFTSPGGASNGGGYIENTDAFQCSPNRPIQVLWAMKSSAAGVSNRVELFWFKSDLTASATPSTSLYSSTANPTSWTSFMNQATPPSDARFAKVRLTGCHTSSTTAGSTWFDNILVRLADYQVPVLEVISASGTWTCPNNVTRVRVRMWGGGGGGLSPGGGGGAGGYAELVQTVVPTTAYTVTIGAGGAPAADGGNTTFDATTVNGGLQGASGAGGAGGAGAGTWGIAGSPGTTEGANIGRYGGDAALGGGGGYGSGNGIVPGGGGGGISTGTAGSGANGRIVLEY